MGITGKRERILTLDLLRGYFLFVIVVDHAQLFPSLFEVVTGRGQMWASAAEGFFLISGLLVGYVYGPRMVRNVFDATKRLWQRAALLYALSALLTFLFVWWGNHSDPALVKEGLWTQPHLGELIFKTLTLQYYYGWADFLPYYAIFMAWAPLALLLITRGKAWFVLAVSGLCWLLRGQSFEMSWQLLFMGSMVAGWYLPRIEAWARGLDPIARKYVRRGLFVCAVALVVASVATIRVGEVLVHNYAGFSSFPIAVQDILIWLDNARIFMSPFIEKWTLEPVRLITAAVWFAALYVWVRSHEHQVHAWSRGWLKTLGERSLVVYVIHAVVIFASLQLLAGAHGFVLNTLLTVGVVAVVYILTASYAAMASHSRRKVSQGLQRLQLRGEESS